MNPAQQEVSCHLNVGWPRRIVGGRVLIVTVLCACLLAVSAAAAVAADTSPPTQPGTITVSSVTAATAALSWGRSTDDVGIEGYRVYRGSAGDADAALALVATTDAVTSYTATNLRSGYAYKFGVMAIDASNKKSSMRTTTLTTGTSTDTTAPAAPSSTSVALTAFSSTRIDVVWGASSSSDVAFYEVRRDGAVVGTIERPNSQRFSDNGLAPSSAHSYTVTAVDSAGNRSSATATKSATTTASGVVKIPRGPYLSNVTASSGVISWWSNILHRRIRVDRREDRGRHPGQRPTPHRDRLGPVTGQELPLHGDQRQRYRHRFAADRRRSGTDVQLRRDRRLRRRQCARKPRTPRTSERPERSSFRRSGTTSTRPRGCLTLTSPPPIPISMDVLQAVQSRGEITGILSRQRQQGVLRRRGILGQLPDAGQQPQLVQLRLG